MESNVQKHGGSLYLRIPKGIAKKHNVIEKKNYDVHEDIWDKIFGEY